MTRYTPKQYARALHQAIVESRPEDQDIILDNLVAILKESGDFGKIDQIEEEFLSCEREVQGIRIAEVTSAKELSVGEEKKIIKDLNAYVGGKVELKKKIDAGLIGGIVIKVGDELIDGSVKKSLEDLKSRLVGEV